MPTVQIEHAIPAFDRWKVAFDRDPARRAESGVRRYRVYRPVDDARYVIIELDFDECQAAEAFVSTMRGIWGQVEGRLMTGPRVRIVDCVEEHEYQGP